MELLLSRSDEPALTEFAALESNYRLSGGYAIDARLESELVDLGIKASLQTRSFVHLSGGEQTRCQLAGLFAIEHGFALIDEPTNHLDRQGRERLGEYLDRKNGFLLVSHDRSFLDACIDHVIALNPDTSETHRLSYSQWRHVFRQRLAAQASANRSLKKDIRRFEAVAGQRRRGAMKREGDKAAHTDKGYIGAQAARQMKRAIAADRRAEQAAEVRRESLNDLEKTYRLKLATTSVRMSHPMLQASNLVVHRDEALFEPVSFELSSTTRLAVLGANGSGKSSLLDMICGSPMVHRGSFTRSNLVEVSRISQHPTWSHGDLRLRLAEENLDETRFRQIMAALGVRGALLEKPIEAQSQGQQKKIELARSMMEPANLLVWDEPLNFIDVDSREQIEEVLLDQTPAMVFVEHDAAFIDHIATEVLELTPWRGGEVG
jgi:lincosamide and streptogramin A transport system ATP-binding/permease protein